jgi:hypothetical protein
MAWHPPDPEPRPEPWPPPSAVPPPSAQHPSVPPPSAQQQHPSGGPRTQPHGGRVRRPRADSPTPSHDDGPDGRDGRAARPRDTTRPRDTDPFSDPFTGPYTDPYEDDQRPPHAWRQPPRLVAALGLGLGAGYGLIAGIIVWRAPLNGTIPLLGIGGMVLLTTILAGGNTRTAAPACLAGFAVAFAAALMLAGWGSPLIDQIIRAAAVITAA